MCSAIQLGWLRLIFPSLLTVVPTGALSFRKELDRFWISANQKGDMSSKRGPTPGPRQRETATPAHLLCCDRSYSFYSFNLRPHCISKIFKRKPAFCNMGKVTSVCFRFSVWKILLSCKPRNINQNLYDLWILKDDFTHTHTASKLCLKNV